MSVPKKRFLLIGFFCFSTLAVPSFNLVAGKALLVVNRNHAPALGTTLSLALISQKRFNSSVPYVFEIVNRTYAVCGLITPIKALKSVAGVS